MHTTTDPRPANPAAPLRPFVPLHDKRAQIGDQVLTVKRSEDRRAVFLNSADHAEGAVISIPIRALPWLINALADAMAGARL